MSAKPYRSRARFIACIPEAHEEFKPGSPNRVALYDLGASASYMTLQAAALGVATHQMVGFDTEKARRSLGIPKDHVMGAAIALGYQGEPAMLPSEKLVQQEITPRSRKPLEEFVLAEWGLLAMLE